MQKKLILKVLFLQILCVTGLQAKYCPNCVRIESEREAEQSKEGFKPPEYYEDYLKKEVADVSSKPTSSKKTVYKEHVNPKTGLLEEDLEDLPPQKPVETKKTTVTTEKKAIALNDDIQSSTNEISTHKTKSILFDVVTINNLFTTFEAPFTIFVPTDEAFKKYTQAKGILYEESRELLLAMISNHIVPNQLLRKDAGKIFKTLGGRNIEITEGEGDRLLVNGVPILRTEAIGNSGVVYVIDQVLIPIHQ